MNATLKRSRKQALIIPAQLQTFLTNLHIGVLLWTCGIRKRCGITSSRILAWLLVLRFAGKEFHRQFLQENPESGKDAIYTFLRNPKANWRRLHSSIATKVIRELNALTNDSRERVLILDDTVFPRRRSKKVELLARVYDHVEHVFLRGFRMLTLGWSDGNSFVPVDFALLSSANAKNRLHGEDKVLDRRCCAAKRRAEALRKATELGIEMVRRALTQLRADFLVMDSWFGFPAVIEELAQSVSVICRVKDMKNIRYRYKERELRLSALYRLLKKRPGRAAVLGSMKVQLPSGREVKLVFVRHRKTGNWAALLSTQTDLADSEVVRIYGKRWSIEVFFKQAKSRLGLAKEVQVRDFDALVAHTTVVMLRAVFLALEHRKSTDDRTMGDLFYAMVAELEDLTIERALRDLLAVLAKGLAKTLAVAEEFVVRVIEQVFEGLWSPMPPGLNAKSES